ncbi:TetR/AcrR family transcriptional regulator [Herbaspirillum sp. GCM10030257]|uniref:TetR/AcrR family transcriptional regulator n=1 Tax=Herbaspirillum sp. GCM10030257 TaxID=3273393 RepID=UPI003606937C
MPTETVPARPYRGMSPDERRAQRRTQLITAAIKVYGERGYRHATVKSVCEAAGLTERYFYESFANSEALLIASFNAVTFTVYREITQAAQTVKRNRTERARAMLRAYFTALQREPRSARVFLVEIRGVSPAVDEAFDQALQTIGRGVSEIVARPGLVHDELLQAGVIGGTIHIALRWIAQGYEPSIEKVIDSALRLGMVLVRKPTS